MNKCPLCHREMIKNSDSINEHHLIPKSKKGKDTITLHKICHNKIHSVFSETELNQYYFTIERILENHHIQNFIKWVSKKEPIFYEKTKDTNDRKRKRGR